MKIIYFFFLTLLFGCQDKNELNEYANYCDSLHKAGSFDGNILIADKGKIVYKASFGKANINTGQDLDENSVFELASVSKQFTAMAIVLLKEKGKLRFDDTISKYIPELSFYKNVTIRNLLNHTGGLPDYMQLMDMTFAKSKIATNNDVISCLAKSQFGTHFKPNSMFDYSNTGYVILATIIERVSGQSFGEFLNKNIFLPLDMKSTLVYRRRFEPKKIDNYAYGYVYSDSLKRNILPDSLSETKMVIWLDGVVGDGTVNSTILDLLKWDRALYTDKLCNKEDMKEIFSPVTLTDGTKSNYGFGWEIVEHEIYGKTVRHSGGWPGYSTYIERHIDNDKTIIILQNYEQPNISLRPLRKILYRQTPDK